MNFRRAQRMAAVEKSVIRQIVDKARPGSINLGLGEPAFPTPEFIRVAAQTALDTPRLGYTANAGMAELRKPIAARYGLSGVDQVCITNGSQEAMMAVMLAMLNEGDRVLLPDPGFLAYPTCVRLCGGECDFYTMPAEGGFTFSLSSFQAALNDKTRLVIINSPANPTGQIISEDDLRAIARLLAGRDIWVLSDEIYADLYYDLKPASMAAHYERTITISGLSKSMSMTGWRLGWCVGPADAIAAITVMHQYLTTCAPTISQCAALPAFGPEAERAVAEFRKQLRMRRDLMAAALRDELQADFVLPQGAFYLMLDVRRWGSSREVAERLLEAGVVTIPGSAFGKHSEGFLRLSFSLPPDELNEGIQRLVAGLK